MDVSMVCFIGGREVSGPFLEDDIKEKADLELFMRIRLRIADSSKETLFWILAKPIKENRQRYVVMDC